MDDGYKAPFDAEQLIGEMMQEIIQLKAENETIKAMLQVVFLRSNPSYPAQSYREDFERYRNDFLTHFASTHHWYEGYWKQKIGDLLPPE